MTEQAAIIKALKSTEFDVRLTCGDRWLVWYDGQYTVYRRKRNQHNTRVLVDTESIESAVQALLTGTSDGLS